MTAAGAVALKASPVGARMWHGGPLRRWSPVRTASCQMPLASGGYGGSYLCDGCQKPVVGIYRAREAWLCAACKMRSETRAVA